PIGQLDGAVVVRVGGIEADRSRASEEEKIQDEDPIRKIERSIIGGIGSIKGAFIGALLVGLVDTMGRFLLPYLFALVLPPDAAASIGGALSSVAIYILMAVILIVKPKGLIAAHG
ncbi:MAG: hypothetical protein MJK13_12940, partial [Pseudomonadales bacterium]|nr:hypothetical protein [Pseudomonadales bacterium]